MTQQKPKVLIGLSGGVDSSVSAALLLEQGYEVIGAFMKNWSNCEWRADRRDAIRVAAKLGIKFITLDFEKQYREKVVENLFSEYAAGRTPNPDVLCNKYVKFDLFMEAAEEIGCDFVATGHYAKIIDGELNVPKDINKDQTYFLYAMPREALSKVIFPLADITKPEVRELAKKYDLAVADKKDSTGICFVGEVNIEEFLKERIPENPGTVVTTAGKEVGTHNGLAYFTIGQRQGLGVYGGGPPYYVVRKDQETNTLIVGTEVDPELFRKELKAEQLNWLVESPQKSFDCLSRIRYRQDLQKTHIEVDGDAIHVTFKESQRAVTPGQSIVLYTEEGIVLGGGIIGTPKT